MPDLTLHQWEVSPFCNKIRRCLNHKSLTFKTENYNGLLALKARKLTPQGQLPVLQHGTVFTADSTAIAAYLDKTFPRNPLLPTDAVARARAKIWNDWAGASLYFFELYYRFYDEAGFAPGLSHLAAGRPAWEQAALGFVLRRDMAKKLKQQGLARRSPADVEADFLSLCGNLETILSSRPYLAGDAVTLADFAVAGQLDELCRTSRLKGQILSHTALAAWLAGAGRA